MLNILRFIFSVLIGAHSLLDKSLRTTAISPDKPLDFYAMNFFNIA